MSIKHLGTRIWLAGLLIVAAAVVWWFVFFSGELDRASGVVVGQSPYLSDFIACLSISEGPCAVIAGLARVGGRVVYEPLLLWTGIAALWMGATLRILAEWRARSAPAARHVRNAA